MDYLLLVYRNQTPNQPNEQLAQACRIYAEWLHQQEQLLSRISVSPDPAIILHRGQLDVQADPGAANALAEVYLIRARDLNNAIHIAAQMPQAAHATIEVRQIQSSGR